MIRFAALQYALRSLKDPLALIVLDLENLKGYLSCFASLEPTRSLGFQDKF